MGPRAHSREVHPSLSSSLLRRSRGVEQAAAVCYRMSGHAVEFLLVRTRAGRWTFPKGGIEPGMTHAQSAALEAYEEAGVHGRIEITSFARYLRRAASKPHAKSILVFAFLCEVHRLGKPHESKRSRTWFSAEKAKRRLRKGRTEACGSEMAAVVDRALDRVCRLHGNDGNPARKTRRDALQKVCFEFWESGGPPRSLRESSASSRQPLLQSATASGVAVDARPQKLLPAHIEQIIPPERASKTAANRSGKVTAIDAARR